MALWRLTVDGAPRLAFGPVGSGPQRLLHRGVTLSTLLADARGLTRESIVSHGFAPRTANVLAPVDHQPIWAAGVTFRRSREARIEEAATGDFYDRVYSADRPELFLKAMPGDVRGTGETICIRADSTWDVPEPEVALVIDSRGNIVGYAVANDVSSRSIEGENPLYLPQAKLYRGSCGLGPCIVPVGEAPAFGEIEVSLAISRRGTTVYHDSVMLRDMHRDPEDLVRWLFRAQRFPNGVVLLTGTSIVPPADFTLEPGDCVTVEGTGLGALTNVVEYLEVFDAKTWSEQHEGAVGAYRVASSEAE